MDRQPYRHHALKVSNPLPRGTTGCPRSHAGGCGNARSHSRKFRYRPLKYRYFAGPTRPRGIAEIVTQSVRIPCRLPQQTAGVVPRPPQLISPTEPARQPPGHGLQQVRHPSKLVQALPSMPGRRSPTQEGKSLMELRMPMRPEAPRSADFDDAATLRPGFRRFGRCGGWVRRSDRERGPARPTRSTEAGLGDRYVSRCLNESPCARNGLSGPRLLGIVASGNGSAAITPSTPESAASESGPWHPQRAGTFDGSSPPPCDPDRRVGTSTLLTVDRIPADRPFCSHRKQGMNVQVIADPQGRPMPASPPPRPLRSFDASAGCGCRTRSGVAGPRGRGPGLQR